MAMAKDERDLMKEAKSGNAEALEELVKQNTGLIWSIVRRFLSRGYDREDLYQIGWVGFIKAVKKFDMNLNYKLSTFAVPYIMGEIKKFFRDDGIIKISRSIKELGIKIRDVQEIYLSENGESITIKKLAKILNTSEENICIAIDAGREVKSINEEIFEGGKEEKINKIENRIDEQTKIVDRINLNNVIENLNSRDKKIIKLRYFNDKTQMEVAKILGISQVQVSRIEKKILENMREKMVG